MGQRVRSVTILFEKDVSEEYIDMIEKTALCYKGVLDVKRDIEDGSGWAIENRIEHEIRAKLFDVFKK